jgi:hypothetical protein
MAVKGTVSHGKSFYVTIADNNGTARDVSGDCTELSWPLAAAVAEAMGAGDSWEEYVAGLKGSKISGTFMLNDVANVGSWAVLGQSIGAKRAIVWAPFGNTQDFPQFSATVVVTGLGVSTNLTSVASFKFDGVTSGTVTIGAVPAP